MTIGSTVHKVMDKLTPGHHTTPGSTGTTGATATNTTSTYQEQAVHHGNVNATSSAGQYGTMEQAGAGSTGAAYAQSGAAAPVQTGATHFAVTEDHAVEKERTERWTEHTPVEREYRTRVEEVGVHAQPGWTEGAVGQERIVGASTAYPTNTTTVTGVAGRNIDNTIDSNRHSY